MGIRMVHPVKRLETRNFSFRQRVPSDITNEARGLKVTLLINGERHQVTIGAEIKVTLGTSEPSTVKERQSEVAVQVNRIWQQIRDKRDGRNAPMSERQAATLGGLYYSGLCTTFEENPGNPDEWNAAWEAVFGMGDSEEGRETMHGAALDQLLSDDGLLPATGDERRLALEALHTAYVQFHGHQERRAGGDYSPDPKAGRFPKPQAQAVATNPPKEATSISLRGLFAEWQKNHEAGNGAPATIRDFRGRIESLIEFRGSDDFAGLDQRGIVAWLDHLRDAKSLSQKTIADKYLAGLKAVLKYAKRRFLITTDPTEGVTLGKARRTSTRDRGFTLEEAKAVLKASLSELPPECRWAPERQRAVRWGAWLAAYTGARVTEIMQLRKKDVGEEDGIPFINITPEAGRVKTSIARKVPLHPHLIEQGFLGVVSSLPEGPVFTTPSDTQAKAHGKAQTAGGRLTEWFWEGTGIKDETLQPNHAWRHRFKTLGRELEISTDTLDAIQGHAPKTAGAAYGQVTLATKYAAIKRFPRYEP